MPDNETRDHWTDEYPSPLPDDLLRSVADSPGAWSKPMALELIAARARITELEAERDRSIDYDGRLAHFAGLSRRLLDEKHAATRRITELGAAHDAACDIARSNSHALNEAKDELCTARELIDWFTDDEPCDFDHHGGCQAHNHYEPDTGAECPNAIALRWLAAHPVEEAHA